MRRKITIVLFLAVLLTVGCATTTKEVKTKSELKGSVLLVIDIQNDYFEGGKYPLANSENASLQAKKLLNFYRDNNLEIVHIQHISSGDDAPFFVKGTEGVEIHKNVSPLSGEKVITKSMVDSFVDTELESYLSGLNVSNLVICGMQTNVCVQAASITGLEKGYSVQVAYDAIAAVNEDVNIETIESFKETDLKLFTVDELLN